MTLDDFATFLLGLVFGLFGCYLGGWAASLDSGRGRAGRDEVEGRRGPPNLFTHNQDRASG